MGWDITEIGLSPIGQHRIDPVYLDRVFYYLVVLLVLGWGGTGCWLDVIRRRLPNWWLMLGGVGLIAITGMVLQHKGTLADDFASAVAAIGTGIGLWFGLYVAVFIINRRSMGAGDVKLAAILGGGVGVVSGEPVAAAIWIAVAILLAAGLTLLIAVVTAGKRGWGDRRKAKTARVLASVPHGPAMLAATAIVWGISGGHLQVP
ncbi:prepilin peptidase [Corynebacterium amycolatum]|uniref:prepilin peptidase n=1 Tax=Corynebacterium amycolatum TaxID=43765 RepID=UPI0038D217E6